MADDLLDFIEGEYDKVATHPYQKRLTRRQCRKLEAVEGRLKENLAGKYKVFVRKTTPLGGREYDPDEVPRRNYWVPVTPETPIDELIAIIETREKSLGFDGDKGATGEGGGTEITGTGAEEAKGTEAGDEASQAKAARAANKKKNAKKSSTKYLYCGTILAQGQGKVFGDYPYDTQLKRWSKPYAGVVWICPNYVAPGFARSRRRKKKPT